MRYQIASRERIQRVLALLREAHAELVTFDGCGEPPHPYHYVTLWSPHSGEQVTRLSILEITHAVGALALGLASYDCEPIDYPLQVLSLSVRVWRELFLYCEIRRLRQLTAMTSSQLLALPGFGRRALSEVRYALSEVDCTLAGRDARTRGEACKRS